LWACKRGRRSARALTIAIAAERKKTAARQWKTLIRKKEKTTAITIIAKQAAALTVCKPNKTKQNAKRDEKRKNKNKIIVHTFSVSISRSMKCVDDGCKRRAAAVAAVAALKIS